MVTNSHYLKLPTSIEMIVINAYPSPKYNNRRQEDRGKKYVHGFKFHLISHSLTIQYIKSFQVFL